VAVLVYWYRAVGNAEPIEDGTLVGAS